MKRETKYRYQQNQDPQNENSARFLATQPLRGKFGCKIRGKVDNSFQDFNDSMESSYLSISMDQILQDNQNILNQSIDQSEISQESTPNLKLSLKRTKSVRFDQQNLQEQPKLPSFVKKNNITARAIIPILKNSSEKSNNNSFSQLNISFNQFRSQRSNIPSRVSVLDDKKNQKRRYASIIDNLKKTKKKYFDDVFPPGSSSIYFSPKDNRFGQIKWVRICQVMKPRYCTLFNKDRHQKCKIKPGQVAIHYMVVGMNALKNQNNYLQHIFQDPYMNDYGVYLLKIFVQGVWRYVIVDDYIPVLIRDRKYVPVFLSVDEYAKNSVQIWPFLVQKAYAKVYSTYQSLLIGNVQDFIVEMTGSLLEKIEINKNLTDFEIQRHIGNRNNLVMLGKQSKKLIGQIDYYPVVKPPKQLDKMSFLERITEQLNVYTQEPFQDSQIQATLLSQINSIYKQAVIFKMNDNNFNVSSHIKQSSTNKDTMSMRTFTVGNTTCCDISLFQKDKKFFRKGYDYSWVRMIIAMKEAQGFRWVKGIYAKKKCLQLSCILDPGQYYIMLMVDWGSKVYDMHLNYSGNSEISFERVSHSEHLNILTQTCVDLAQRFGQFEQISSNLCSYKHFDTDQGLIIDNINNQSELKEMAYSKSYCKSMNILMGLKPVNEGIHTLIEDFIRNRNVIVTRIKPKGSYTLILKVKNGEDLDVIDCFGLED